jgi:hypothetical protein
MGLDIYLFIYFWLGMAARGSENERFVFWFLFKVSNLEVL